MTKKTLTEVIAFIEARMLAQQVPGTRRVYASNGSATLDVERHFNVRVDVYFTLDVSGDSNRWLPRVSINAPAVNAQALAAVAFATLVSELALFAATLQVQLDDFTIPAE